MEGRIPPKPSTKPVRRSSHIAEKEAEKPHPIVKLDSPEYDSDPDFMPL